MTTQRKRMQLSLPFLHCLQACMVDTATAVQLSNLNSVHCRNYAAWTMTCSIIAAVQQYPQVLYCIHACVRLPAACLDRPLTVNHFRLLFCVFTSYVKFEDHSIVEDVKWS